MATYDSITYTSHQSSGASSNTYTNCTFSGIANIGYSNQSTDDRVDVTAVFRGCTFSNNKNSGGNGGALYNCSTGIFYSPDAIMTIEDCIFDGNSASNGGAIYNYSQDALINEGRFVASVTVKNSVFKTTTDTIYSQGTQENEETLLKFKGENKFAGNISAETTIKCDENAILHFINYDAITISAGFTGLSCLKFMGSNEVNFSTALAAGSLAIEVGNAFAANDALVGTSKTIATGLTGLSDSKEVIFDGVGTTIGASALSYSNNTLSSLVKFAQSAKNSERTSIAFVTSNYSEDFGTVVAGCDKSVTGRGVSTTSLTGNLYAGENTVSMSDLSYGGRVYGGVSNEATATFGGATVTLNNVKIASGSRVYGGADLAATGITVNGSGTINLSINATSDSQIAQVYGGGRLAQSGCEFDSGAINTTINGGTYTGFVGNGSQAVDGIVTATTTSLTVNGGVFNSYVYAGMYSQSSTVVATVSGNTTLTINGGTFNGIVFGGSAASRNVYARTTYINGAINVAVNANSSEIVFNNHLFAGSQANGNVSRSTTITFTGLGSNLTFGSDVYVSGGCETDADYSNVADVRKSVGGDRNLVFSNFSGNFGANLKNLFESVTFSESKVTFTATKEVDMHLVDTWNFDLSDNEIDLTWTNGTNNFAGDTMKLTGFTGSEKTIMAGSADTLKNWDKLGALYLGDTKLTSEGISEDGSYVKYSHGGTDYKLSVDSSNNMKFGYLA